MNNAKKFDHRHSRESGNPAKRKLRVADKTEVSFRYAEICNQLDSRFHPQGVRRGCKGASPQQHTLRGNDGK